MNVVLENGEIVKMNSCYLSRDLTSKIFGRTGDIHHIEVFLDANIYLKYL